MTEPDFSTADVVVAVLCCLLVVALGSFYVLGVTQ